MAVLAGASGTLWRGILLDLATVAAKNGQPFDACCALLAEVVTRSCPAGTSQLAPVARRPFAPPAGRKAARCPPTLLNHNFNKHKYHRPLV